MKVFPCFLSTFCAASVFDKQPEGDWEIQIGENQHLWTEELIEENWEIEFDILNNLDGESSTYTGLLYLSETLSSYDRVFSVFQKGFTNVLNFSWNWSSSSKSTVCEFAMPLGEWNSIKVSVMPSEGEAYTIAGITESQIQISLNGVVQDDCSRKQIHHAKYGDVAVKAAHDTGGYWATPSDAHLRNLRIRSWDATPPGEKIWAKKTVKTIKNVKDSWRLSFDLLKTTEPSSDFENFLSFSKDCTTTEDRAASLFQVPTEAGGSKTYFSVNCNDTDGSSTSSCADITDVGFEIPTMSWQNVVFEQTKMADSDAYKLRIDWNGENVVERLNTNFAPFTNGGIRVSDKWQDAASGFIDNIEFETWALENECALGTHKCDVNAVCSDLEKFYDCACSDGFEGDGFFCEEDQDPCACTDGVKAAMKKNEKALFKWRMMRPLHVTNTASTWMISSSSAANRDQYQGYLIFSRKTCKQLVLDLFMNDSEFSFHILDLRQKGSSNPMPNYSAFEKAFYRNYENEHKNHRSVTIGFNVNKTEPDVTGNQKKDSYILELRYPAGLPDGVNWEEIYNCLNMAKPVTIPTGHDELEQHGHNATCDYSRCVGNEVKVGY